MHRLRSETSPEFWARIMKLDIKRNPRVGKLVEWGGYFVRRAIRNDRSGPTWLVLEGPTGTGKTTVGKFCVRAFNSCGPDLMRQFGGEWDTARRPSAEYVNWSRFCQQAEAEGDAPGRILDLKENSVIVLDDVGADVDRFKTGANKQYLKDLLDAFDKRWLMISTNVPKIKWADAFGERAASRMDSAKRFDTTGIPDFRLTQGTRTL